VAAEDFNERRMRTGESSLDVDGQRVEAVLRLPSVPPGSVLRVLREASTEAVEQAVIVRTSKGKFALPSGARASKLVLWSTTAPAEVALPLTNRVPAEVVLYNAWRSQQWGNVDAWLRFSGILIEPLGEHEWRLRCSDGVGPADFDDLVLRIALGTGGTPTQSPS
jgi:hypothetical protein